MKVQVQFIPHIRPKMAYLGYDDVRPSALVLQLSGSAVLTSLSVGECDKEL